MSFAYLALHTHGTIWYHVSRKLFITSSYHFCVGSPEFLTRLGNWLFYSENLTDESWNFRRFHHWFDCNFKLIFYNLQVDEQEFRCHILDFDGISYSSSISHNFSCLNDVSNSKVPVKLVAVKNRKIDITKYPPILSWTDGRCQI